MRVKIARIAAGAAIAAGLGAGFVHQEARAASNTVWLWKDGLGKCPAVCDGSQFVCPCRTAEKLPEDPG